MRVRFDSIYFTKMFETAIEGYQLMIFVFLHLTILACN